MHEREIAQALNDLWLESFTDFIPGRLGVITSATPTFDVVASEPGYVYVSLGFDGSRGRTTALNKVGADTSVPWQEVKMRRERGELVIREAAVLAGGGGGGSGTLAGLSDVNLTSLSDGHTLEYDSGTNRWINVVPSGGGGGAPSPHGLSSSHHNGQLNWNLINTAGSNLTHIATRQHAALQGITANDHHNQVHNIVGSDHTLTASALQVVGATATDTLGLLTPSANPGDNAALLRTNANGGLALDTTLFVVDAPNDRVTMGGTHFVVDVAGDEISVNNTLLLIDTNLNTVKFDTSLFAIDAVQNTVKIGTSLMSADTDTSIFAIDTNLVYADGTNKRVGVNRTPGSAALDVIAYSNSDHTQRLKQKDGQTGRLWRVEDKNGNELIVLNSEGDLASGHPGFVSGLTGWRITHHGNAEFNNIWARGELHATIFVKDEVHATGGTMLVATAGKLYSDAEIDSTTVDTEGLQFEQGNGLEDWEIEQGDGPEPLIVSAILNYIEIEDSPTGPGFYFNRRDVVRSKTEVETGVTDFWLEIRGRYQMDGYQRYSVQKRSGTDGLLPAGSGVVSYGVPGDGRILLTSDLQDAPYMDVFTVGPEVWTAEAGSMIQHVRIGRLDGVNVPGVGSIKQYGLIAGTDLTDANSPYIVASNLGLRLHKINLTLHDGNNTTGELTADGNVKLGTNIGTVNGTSFQVISQGADAGDLIIGRLAGNYLHWDQSAGALHVRGDLIIDGTNYLTEEGLASSPTIGGINSSIGSINSSIGTINDTLDDIPGDITAAQSAAQTYSNARRIVGVSGTWTPVNPVTSAVSPNTIWWSSVTIRTANAVTKTVNNGNTGNMGGQTFLHANLTAAGNLTLSAATDIGTIPAGNTIVAVCEPGAEAAQVVVMGGKTWISGDQIVTGSIVGNNIKAATIVGGHIIGSELSTIKTNTGALTVSDTLTVGTSGAIRSGTKTYGASVAGFFLGYVGNPINAHVFDIGNASKYLRWDGSNLTYTGDLVAGSVTGSISVGEDGRIRSGNKSYGSGAGFFLGWDGTAHKFDVGSGSADRILFDGSSIQILTSNTLSISRNAGGAMITLLSSAGSTSISWNYPNISFSAPLLGSSVSATFQKLINSGDTFQIATQRTIATNTSAGLAGEICWDGAYLYLCTANNVWRRLSLFSAGWQGAW